MLFKFPGIFQDLALLQTGVNDDNYFYCMKMNIPLRFQM